MRLALFYHVWAPATGEAWQFLIDEQVKRMVRAKLHEHAELYCVITGPKKDRICKFVDSYGKFTEVKASDADAQFEGATLIELFQKCKNKKYDRVGYLHTKGIRFYSSEVPPIQFRALNSWRHLMETVVLDNWRACVRGLNHYDIAGANFRAEPWPHFSGNFWWANAAYVETLIPPKLENFPEENPLKLPLDHRDRLNFEKWIGMNKPRTLGFISQPFNHAAAGRRDKRFFDLHTEDVYDLIEANADFWLA